MSYHLRVLHSLVKLSRSNSAPSRAVLLNRAGGTDTALGDALDTLVSLGLVRESLNSAEPLRLTLEGLAVGSAYAAAEAARASTLEEPVRVARAGRAGRVAAAPVSVRRERRSVARSVASRAA